MGNREGYAEMSVECGMLTMLVSDERDDEGLQLAVESRGILAQTIHRALEGVRSP